MNPGTAADENDRFKLEKRGVKILKGAITDVDGYNQAGKPRERWKATGTVKGQRATLERKNWMWVATYFR